MFLMRAKLLENRTSRGARHYAEAGDSGPQTSSEPNRPCVRVNNLHSGVNAWRLVHRASFAVSRERGELLDRPGSAGLSMQTGKILWEPRALSPREIDLGSSTR
jgi:hypothetical protein